MARQQSWLDAALVSRRLTRRDFVEFCGAIAAYFSLPTAAAQEMADAVEKSQKPSLVWLEFQDCAGNTESFLRASGRRAAEIILDTLASTTTRRSWRRRATRRRPRSRATVEQNKGEYIAVIEGSIPTGARRLLHHRRAVGASRSRARCAAARRRPSPSAPAPPSAASRRPRPTRPARWASPTPSRA